MAGYEDVESYTNYDSDAQKHLEADEQRNHNFGTDSDYYEQLPGIKALVLSEDLDINDAFDSLLLIEEGLGTVGFQEGFEKGVAEGNVEGYHLGYHRGAELGAELGYYSGIVDSYLEHLKDEKGAKIDKIFKNLVVLQSLIVTFPRENSEEVDILDLMDNIRCLFKKVCSSLKISSIYPEADKLNF